MGASYSVKNDTGTATGRWSRCWQRFESLSEGVREYNEGIEKLAQQSYPQVALLKQVKPIDHGLCEFGGEIAGSEVAIVGEPSGSMTRSISCSSRGARCRAKISLMWSSSRYTTKLSMIVRQYDPGHRISEKSAHRARASPLTAARSRPRTC